MTKKIKALIILFLFSTFWCYGYIDPGTGSYVIQILIAAFVGISVGLRVFWKNIKEFFRKLFKKEKKEEAQ